MAHDNWGKYCIATKGLQVTPLPVPDGDPAAQIQGAKDRKYRHAYKWSRIAIGIELVMSIKDIYTPL